MYKNYMNVTGTRTVMTPGTRSSSSKSKSWGSRCRCILSPSLRYVFFSLYSFINLLIIYFLIDCMYTINTTTTITITFTTHPNNPATAGRARDADTSQAPGMSFFFAFCFYFTNEYLHRLGWCIQPLSLAYLTAQWWISTHIHVVSLLMI